MKTVDYEALKNFKARLDATFASKAETDALAVDVNDVKQDIAAVKEDLTWR